MRKGEPYNHHLASIYLKNTLKGSPVNLSNLAMVTMVICVFVPGTASSDTGTTVISANMNAKIVINAPCEITSWTLDPDGAPNTSPAGTLIVKANKSWWVTASDTDTTTAGHMTKYASGAYDGSRKLTNAMFITAPNSFNPSNSYNVTLPTGGTIQAGNMPGGSSNVNFKVYGSWNDMPLGDTGVYHIVVTFTGSLVP